MATEKYVSAIDYGMEDEVWILTLHEVPEDSTDENDHVLLASAHVAFVGVVSAVEWVIPTGGFSAEQIGAVGQFFAVVHERANHRLAEYEKTRNGRASQA